MSAQHPAPQHPQYLEEDEIDIRELILPLWHNRFKILKAASLTALIGLIIGFMTPTTYTATSTFIPQTAEAGGGSNLGGLAALAGINLNAGGSGADIPSTLYPKVLSSAPFKAALLDAHIHLDGDSITYREYLSTRPNPAISVIKKYTIGLPGTLVGLMTSKKEITSDSLKEKLSPLNDKEYGLQQSIGGLISIESNKKEGYVTLTVVDGDPKVAAQVALATEAVLQDWIIDYKIKNAKAQYDFTDRQFQLKQKEFFALQDELASFKDRNQNISSALFQNRLSRIEAEFSITNAVYTELAKQKEQAAIQLSKDTPTFSVIDPVAVPKQKTGPKKSLYLLGGFFLGFFLTAGYTLIKKPVTSFLSSLQAEPQS
jgi:uncharacterized protein involved in exopolysaccharide biosynthesis